MRTVKEIPFFMSLAITQLINMMIRTNTFPQALKVARIIPLSKKDKPKNELNSFRPISNLTSIEKIIEQVLKNQMIKFLETNSVLIENHHGGIKHHNTVSAKAMIEVETAKSMEANKVTVLVSTDLGSAYDLISHEHLLEKLAFYGIKDNSNDLIRSYLDKRVNYVEIEGFESKKKEAKPVSVVQGSKWSSLLYSLYTKEVPRLAEVMNNEELYAKIVGKKLQKIAGITHTTVQYIDDSNSVIGGQSKEDVNAYLQQYYTLLHTYYSSNKLVINGEKTALLEMINTETKRDKTEINFKTEKGEVVKPKKQIKILG